MAKTALLPPITAIRMVWALTGKFSDDEPSQAMARFVEDSLKRIEDDVQKQGISPKEKGYVMSAIATMKASLRSLDTAYKGRTLNFEENEKLRSAYLESIKESLSFGTKAEDILKSLPAMTISAAGGVTIADAIGISGVTLWAVGLLLAALGYVINLMFVRKARAQTQMLYVIQDYERGLYFDQYISRVRDILSGLFLDLERIHAREFQENYEKNIDPSALETILKSILAGVGSTFCPFVHKHMQEKKVTPELWTICESGHMEARKICRLWEAVRENPVP